MPKKRSTKTPAKKKAKPQLRPRQKRPKKAKWGEPDQVMRDTPSAKKTAEDKTKKKTKRRTTIRDLEFEIAWIRKDLDVAALGWTTVRHDLDNMMESEKQLRHDLENMVKPNGPSRCDSDGVTSPTEPPDGEYYLSDARVAEITGLSRRFFQIARQRGDGPPYVRISARCVRYRWADVESWLTARRRTSTQDELDDDISEEQETP